MSSKIKLPTNMRTFYSIWVGQTISKLGSSLTSFAVGLWLFSEGGSVTAFALNNVFFLVPWALLSPIAGAIVDRYDRKKIMIISDTVQALATLFIGVFVFFDFLQIWHVYLAVALSAASFAFQGPALSASISMIVPKKQLGRAAGMGLLGDAVGRLAVPALAGALILSIGLEGIILIDVITFLVAVTVLIFVRIPNPPKSEVETSEDSKSKKSLRKDVVYGLRYLYERFGLFNLMVIMSLRNLFQNFAGTLTIPMLLIIANEAEVGSVMSIASSGMLLGTVFMSIWGGPKRRVPLLLWMLVFQGFAIVIIGLLPSLILITIGYFIMTFTFAFLAALSDPIWQSKVELSVQGRVFAMLSFFGIILEPMEQIIVGPLTDIYLEPMIQR